MVIVIVMVMVMVMVVVVVSIVIRLQRNHQTDLPLPSQHQDYCFVTIESVSPTNTCNGCALTTQSAMPNQRVKARKKVRSKLEKQSRKRIVNFQQNSHRLARE